MSKLISVHVPKTGGTTFLCILENIYGERHVFKDYKDDLFNPEVLFNLDNDEWWKQIGSKVVEEFQKGSYKVVHGHFLVKKYHFLDPSAKKIIMLRNPVDRVISSYFQCRRQPTNKLPLNVTIDEWVSSPNNNNWVTKMLSEFQLEDFFFVGITENYIKDVLSLAKKMNWNKNRVLRKLKAPKNVGKEEAYLDLRTDKNLRNKIKNLNLEDINLYEKALYLKSKNFYR